MIDLHIHSVYSDGSKTVEKILKMCEEKKLEYISITDHNTAKQYENEALKNNKIFSGKDNQSKFREFTRLYPKRSNPKPTLTTISHTPNPRN